MAPVTGFGQMQGSSGELTYDVMSGGSRAARKLFCTDCSLALVVTRGGQSTQKIYSSKSIAT